MSMKDVMRLRAPSRSTRTVKCLGGVLLISGFILGMTVEPAWGRECDADEQCKLIASDGAAGDYLGGPHTVAISGDWAVIGARSHDHCAPDAGAAYVFRYDGSWWIEVQELLASDCAAGDSFGGRVAIEGDTIVIGAVADVGTGSAYVFRYNGSSWIQEAKLLASDGVSGDLFGSAAVFGDTIVIGAPGDDSYTGSAYVFEKPVGGWSSVPSPIYETAKLTACDAQPNSSFGNSVTISGDTVVIGAPADDEIGGNAGAAYVFEKGAGWTNGCANQVGKLLACDGAAGDVFGSPVSMSGDTVVMGAYADDGNAGSAYVFEKGAGWVNGCANQAAKLTASDRGGGDYFGHGAALSGDIVVVGAPKEDSVGNDAGAAYVFAKPPEGWMDMTETVKLTASDGATGDELNCAAISGDTAIVGAIADDNLNGTNAGSAYVFVGLSDCNGNGVLDICDIAAGTSQDSNGNGIPNECEFDCVANEQAKLLASDGGEGDMFGFGNGVAISGDVAVIGAPGHDHCVPNVGAAYVFRYDGSSWVFQQELLASECAEGEYFGSSVAIEGDIIVIGARNDYTSGSAYVFRFDGTSWSQEAKLLASDGAAGDQFSNSVAVSGDTIVIGANWAESYTGSAYVFTLDGTSWGNPVPGSDPPAFTERAKLTACDPKTDAWFGVSVTIFDDTAVIGALVDDNENGHNAGAAYVFEKGAGWADGCTNQVAKLLAADGAGGDVFGAPVSLSGDTVAIGAYSDDGAMGSAYVFEKDAGWADGSANQVAKLIASDRDSNDYFGHDGGISGDIIVMGALAEDPGGITNAGAAYVFARPPGGWMDMTETVKLTASDGAAGDYFGRGAISGNTAIVGARQDDNENGVDAGAAYSFTGLSDCNANGTLDICDIADGTSSDVNGNGIPDECDNQPPVASCQDVVVSPDENCEGVVVAGDVDNGSYDPDDDPIELSVSPPGPYPLGSTTVTLTVTDDSDASDTCTAIVTVVDDTPPDITCPDDMVLECPADTSVAANGTATATDNCGAVIITHSDAVVAGPEDGQLLETITRTWTATDACGNAANCDQIITALDTTPPVLTCPANGTVECDGAGNVDQLNTWLNSFAASDVCGSVTLGNDFTGLSDGCGETGSATVTFTAADECGNTASCPATFTIEDTTAPDVTCSVGTDVLWSPDHKLAEVGLEVTVSDDCDPAGAEDSLIIEVWSDETEIPDTGDGTGRHAPDAKDIYAGLRLRKERRGGEDGRVYLIIARAEDGCGNVGFGYCAVVVPHDQSEDGLAEVAAQAEATLATVASTPGTTIAEKVAPLGYTQHGVSEELGPHQ